MKHAHRTLASLLVLAGAASTGYSQVYVTRQGSFSPTGFIAEPFDTIKAGLCVAPAATDVIVAAGQYRETGRFDNAGRVIASGGKVVIGRSAAATVPVRVVSYNAHLFGLEIEGLVNAVVSLADSLPLAGDALADWVSGQITETQWQDPARAAWFGRLLPGTGADAVGIQEFWDDGLVPGFLSNYGPTYAMYPDQRIFETWNIMGFDAQIPFALNSGMMLASPTPLDQRVEIPYGAEDGFFESLATKSFQRGTLNKGGLSVGIFHTHTQADTNSSATNARRIQLHELGIAIQQYRQANPSHPVIVIGDFNVIAASTEYSSTMRSVLGSGAMYSFPFPAIAGPMLKDAGKSLACAAEGTACTSCASNELRQYFNSTDTVSKRLDYALYQDSLDGTVHITPTAYQRLELEVPATSPALTQDGYSARALSDHYGLQVDFQLTRE